MLMPPHMPSYLRIDQDIQEGLIKVAKYANEYANFNIQQLEWQIQRKLELGLDEKSLTYRDHCTEIEK